MRHGLISGVLALLVAMLLPVVPAQAVSLGKITIASHLGEPFFAEVSVLLDEGENPAAVFVELATPADFQMLEVYRDSSLAQLSVEMRNDARGLRAELTSMAPINSGFFNLVLKSRYELATHFKKYPVFLDLPEKTSGMAIPPLAHEVAPAAEVRLPAPTLPAPLLAPEASLPVPTMPMANGKQPAVGSHAVPIASAGAPAAPDAVESDWARTNRYGPMVYGDTIGTVAMRLRKDERYTVQQVMMALFEKNRGKFTDENINLIRAGTFIEVPSAAEVAATTPEQARAMLGEQQKRWRDMVSEPRYAAVAEAQRTRYSKRVRIGEMASGVAAADAGAATKAAAAPVAPVAGAAQPTTVFKADPAVAAQLSALQDEHEKLKGQLADSQKRVAELESRPGDAEAEAAVAKAKKLEIQVARLQGDLDQARQEAEASAGFDMLVWILLGAVVLLGGALGFVLYKKRGKRAAPAFAETAAAPGAWASSAAIDDVPEIDVEELPASAPQATVRAFTPAPQPSARYDAPQLTDSIPNLTDHDTAEMEPFNEPVEEEPDPNVDYLAEADVYLRYGMDDEALQQVRMAIRQRANNVKAHVKLVQLLHGNGDMAGVQEAISAAGRTLLGNDLEQFQQGIAELGSVALSANTGMKAAEERMATGTVRTVVQPSHEAAMTLRSGDVDDLKPAATVAAATAAAISAADDFGALDFDLSGLSALDEMPSAPAEESGFDDLDFGGFELGGQEDAGEVASAAPSSESSVGQAIDADEEGFDFESPGLDFITDTGSSAKAEVTTAAPEPESDTGLDFGWRGGDEAGLEFSPSGVATAPTVAPQQEHETSAGSSSLADDYGLAMDGFDFDFGASSSAKSVEDSEKTMIEAGFGGDALGSAVEAEDKSMGLDDGGLDFSFSAPAAAEKSLFATEDAVTEEPLLSAAGGDDLFSLPAEDASAFDEMQVQVAGAESLSFAGDEGGFDFRFDQQPSASSELGLAAAPAVDQRASGSRDLGFSFDLDISESEAPSASGETPAAAVSHAPSSGFDLNFDLEGFDDFEKSDLGEEMQDFVSTLQMTAKQLRDEEERSDVDDAMISNVIGGGALPGSASGGDDLDSTMNLDNLISELGFDGDFDIEDVSSDSLENDRERSLKAKGKGLDF